MGAWGTGPFENDGAMDWVWLLDDASDLEPLTEVFDEVGSSDEYVEVDAGQCVVAGAAILLAVLDGRPEDLPESAQPWAGRLTTQPATNEIDLAVAALQRVRGGESEIAELWADANPEDNTAWLATVQRLEDRLTAHR
jgi:hypothetical protein